MSSSSSTAASAKAVILCGGPYSRTSRFRPLSMERPKPLFPIAGKPIIWHHLSALAAVPAVKEVLLVGFFDDHAFSGFIEQAAADFPGLRVRYLREYTALGTAGGIYHFRDELLRGNPSHLFVLHSDVCCSFPLADMLDFHIQKGGLATLLGTRVDREASRRYGCLVADADSKELLHYVEKPDSFVSNLISCGVHIFNAAQLFDEIRAAIATRAAARAQQNALGTSSTDADDSDAAPDSLRLEQDLLRPLAHSATSKLFVFETKDFWRQVKSAGSVVPASGAYLEQMRSAGSPLLAKPTTATRDADGKVSRSGPEIVGAVLIHPAATVDPSAKLGPNVVVGPRVTVGRGARIQNAIVLDGSEVKAGALVKHAVVGWRSKIGAWSRVEGSPFEGIHESSAAVTKEGQMIKSVTILGQDVVVKDEVYIRNSIVLPHKELSRSFHLEVIM